MSIRVVCFGPGPVFKGGIQNYNTSLAKAFDQINGVEVAIVSWTQLYPSIFPRDLVDRNSKNQLLEGSNIEIEYITNYNNPFTWSKTVKKIMSLDPHIVVFQWSLAIQGLPMGWIAGRLKKKCKAELIFDCHFVIQKEGSRIDNLLTKYGLKHAHTYVTHANQTTVELKDIFSKQEFEITEKGIRTNSKDHKTIIKLFHPVYDLFSPDPGFDVEAFKRVNGLKEHVFLFFGFIRKYKGLHHVIKAFKILSDRRDDVSLIICGESFWDTLDKSKFSTRLKNFLFGIAQSLLLKKKQKESDYRPLDLLDEYQLREKVLLKNEYVPNEDVHKYFQASDAALLFYEYATPSGVESISYNFRMPLLATRVGHFPETIEHGINGYLADSLDLEDMASTMEEFINKPINSAEIEKKIEGMSWSNYACAILNTN